MKVARAALPLAMVLAAQLAAQTATTGQPGQGRTRELTAFLERQAQRPEDYVISKFAAHDLVLIGEPHYVRQHVEFIQGMIPKLYQNGIYTLAIEFARRVDQQLIDSLITRPVYDEELARRLVLQFLESWGYQEYVDLYRAAWQLNQGLPAGARRFRILALNGAPDWSIVKTDAEYNDWRIRLAALHCETEKDWAQVIVDNVLSKREKALVYTGTHHAFTKYAQPIVNNGRLLRTENERFGQYLYRLAPDRLFMIALHQPWSGPSNYDGGTVLPADGAIDDAVAAGGQPRVGFDLVGTPFGAVSSDNTIYKHGHEPFTLDKFADGYVVLGPIADFQPVRAIPEFINANNLEYVRQHTALPSERKQTAEEFNRGMASAAQFVEIWRKVGRRAEQR